MFGHDDKQNDDVADDSPFGAGPAKPDPKPDGVLDDTMGPPPPPPATPTPFEPPKPPEPPTMPPLSDDSNDASSDDSNSSSSADDLISLKQSALKELTPLVDQLDQSPEEKFNTTMMMIQAADDQTLISSAYKTAQQITDDKERAQALLDIVNEINYFTQKDTKSDD